MPRYKVENNPTRLLGNFSLKCGQTSTLHPVSGLQDRQHPSPNEIKIRTLCNCEVCCQPSPTPHHVMPKIEAKTSTHFLYKFFDDPSGHGRPHQRSWTSAPENAFSCGTGGGDKLFDPWASGHKGQECPRELRTEKLMFVFFPLKTKGLFYSLKPSSAAIIRALCRAASQV